MEQWSTYQDRKSKQVVFFTGAKIQFTGIGPREQHERKWRSAANAFVAELEGTRFARRRSSTSAILGKRLWQMKRKITRTSEGRMLLKRISGQARPGSQADMTISACLSELCPHEESLAGELVSFHHCLLLIPRLKHYPLLAGS
jgi:hypothetical protein